MGHMGRLERVQGGNRKGRPTDRRDFPPVVIHHSYLRWLPAPMNSSMGIDNIKLTRDASSAVRPHWAISAGAGVPWAAAVTAAIILRWFGQMTAWTLAIMIMPNNPPIPSATAPVPPR